MDTAWIWKEIEKQGLDGDKLWDYFEKNANCEKSLPYFPVVDLLNTMLSNSTKIIFLTARCEKIYNGTLDRLKNLFPQKDFILLMRPLGNNDRNTILKEKFLKEIINEYRVHLAIEDDTEICDMYERYSIPTIRCHIRHFEEEENEKKEKVQA